MSQKEKSAFYKCGLEISKSCTNTSTAKYCFSFSKAPRFGVPSDLKEAIKKKEEDRQRELELREEEKKKLEQHKYIKHDFYVLPSTLNKRYTKIEKANKYRDEQFQKLSRFNNYNDIVLERQKQLEEKRKDIIAKSGHTKKMIKN